MKAFLQTPELHESVVQPFWSSQSAVVVQGLQPSSEVLEHMPPSQVSMVQRFWSSQSAGVVQGLQGSIAVLEQTPALQVS